MGPHNVAAVSSISRASPLLDVKQSVRLAQTRRGGVMGVVNMWQIRCGNRLCGGNIMGGVEVCRRWVPVRDH